MLAKSYSKLMRSIGEELKHIGPFTRITAPPSRIQRSPSKNPSQGSPGKKKIEENSDLDGIKEIIGVSMMRPTRTANGGPRQTGSLLPG